MDKAHLDRIEAVIENVSGRLDSVEQYVGELFPIGNTQREPDPSPDRDPFPIPEDTSVFDFFLQHIVQGFSEELLISPDHARDRLDSTETPVCTMGFDSRIEYANPALGRLLESDPSHLKGVSLQQKVLPGYREAFQTRLRQLATTAGDTQAASSDDILLFRLETESGERLSIECIVLCRRQGNTRGVIAALRDLQVQQSMLDEYRRAQQDYDTLSETITEAVLRINEDFKIVHANSAVADTFGYEPAEILRRSFAILFPDGEFERYKATFRKYFIVDDHDRETFGLDRSIEILGKQRDGGVIPMELTAGNSKQYNERTLTCIIRDISERKTMERRLRNLAYYDKLTGAGNRDLFNTNLRTALESITDESGSSDTRLALMFLDLDGFKQVNDTLGHEAGDHLLIETAGRIRESLGENGSVYRFGGDEFVVLMTGIESDEEAVETANGLLAAIRRPFDIRGESGATTTATVGVSIGITYAPRDASGIEDLVRAADMAMYDAKHRGKNRYSVFSSDLDADNAFRWDLKQGLQRGIEQGHFFLEYQPLVDTDGTPQGYEALLRWNHPVHGRVGPDEFISVAEESGFMATLGSWVIHRACHEFVSLPVYTKDGSYLSINVSTRQLEDESFLSNIVQAVETSGIDPARLYLELTETSLMSAPDAGIGHLRALRARLEGIRVVIDDFGTGFSSLNYLSRFPVDALKIDRSFVLDIGDSPEDANRKIVRAVVGLAHSLGLLVIGEGVETDEQWNVLVEEQCDTLQGFRFGRGVPAGELMRIGAER